MESVQVTIFSWGITEGTTTTTTATTTTTTATITTTATTTNAATTTSETTTNAATTIITSNNQPEIGRNTVVEATYSWHPKSILLAQNICMLDGDRAIMIRNKDLNKAIMVSIRRNLSTLMHDRNLPIHLANINRTSERVVFGVISMIPNVTDIMEALHYWAETGDEKQFRLILYYHPELKNAATIDGQTVLMLAVDLGLWSAVVLLLCIGAEKNITDAEGNSLYHIAAKKGHKQIIEGLMLFFADEINWQNFKGETALHCSVLNGHLSCIDQLLNAPTIDPNIQDNEGNTPLHILSTMEEIPPTRDAMLHRLLSSVKIDQLIVNNDGLTALQLAIIANQHSIVESMIHMKPSLLSSDSSYSLLPLHLAAAYGHINVLEIILKYSSDVKKTTKASRTALHFAVERWDGNADKDMQRLSCIQLLVSSGVPLNTRDCDGMTALHLAAQATQGEATISNDKIQIVLQMKKSNMRLEELASTFRPHWPVAVMCFLIAQGADPQIRDRSGSVPFELVIEPTLKSLFEQYVACRPRSCIPMSRTIARSFDTTEVTMCTFNCDDNRADIVFIPCGHRVVCATCAGNTLLRRCPLCYQQIITAKNSYGEVVEIGGNIIRYRKYSDAELGENIRVIDKAEIEKIAQEAVERAKKAAEEEKNVVVRELRDKLEQLELEITCAICMDQRCSIVFQCGHTACVECSNPSKLKLCHICRQIIKRRTTIYT
ncbi:unnamed protein product [Wuchereria bancrofti]|uniref:RING-type domain-containing protein n=1 Tax=Wuchereria bancrofti TaxID=6293 RepID=A0A3P7GJP5_WUCBA|nr:unnamed protein product [Wuchereria bancrofti]